MREDEYSEVSPRARLGPASPAHVLGGLDAEIALPWLIRLRWGAVLGQLITIIVVGGGLGVAIPGVPLGVLLSVTAATNLALLAGEPGRWSGSQWLIPAVLFTDVVTLTLMLHVTGGAANPFAAFYLVHVAMAAVVLSSFWPWLMAGLSSVAYGVLYLSYWPLPEPWQSELSPETLIGIGARWSSFTLVALLVTFFLTRLTAALSERERLLADAREQAINHARVASVTTLAAGAAHELGSPLATIAIASKELENQVARLENANELVDDARLIRAEVQRCRGILDRLSLPNLDATAPAELVEWADLEAELRVGLGRRRDRLRCRPRVHHMLVRRGPLVTALGSLIRNAIRASPPDAHVDLEVERERGHILFWVRDEGIGMSPETLEKLGRPFFTSKEHGEGMGLGVFLTRLLAEQLGGGLSFHSEEGVGTVALLRLPEALSDDEPDEEEEELDDE